MTAKHVWLVSKIGYRDDEPKVVCPTKTAAKQWVKTQDPTLVFRDDGKGFVGARTSEARDWVLRYAIEKLPFENGDTQ